MPRKSLGIRLSTSSSGYLAFFLYSLSGRGRRIHLGKSVTEGGEEGGQMRFVKDGDRLNPAYPPQMGSSLFRFNLRTPHSSTALSQALKSSKQKRQRMRKLRGYVNASLEERRNGTLFM
ncbi:hypothetical protein RUM43_008062 [Polyplax serrata]|uniref:Uncharacterized protein n=1 Tax=Polyplax serrata TaxID=468196 RepID=A0AAN8PYC2_POLSC